MTSVRANSRTEQINGAVNSVPGGSSHLHHVAYHHESCKKNRSPPARAHPRQRLGMYSYRP